MYTLLNRVTYYSKLIPVYLKLNLFLKGHITILFIRIYVKKSLNETILITIQIILLRFLKK